MVYYTVGTDEPDWKIIKAILPGYARPSNGEYYEFPTVTTARAWARAVISNNTSLKLAVYRTDGMSYKYVGSIYWNDKGGMRNEPYRYRNFVWCVNGKNKRIVQKDGVLRK